MNRIEEQLWDYIDGNCTPEESAAIAEKIAVNIQYHKTYQELLAVHAELNKIDFEEPSMSFTRNVMEKVDLELPPVALKTKVDQRIVQVISGLFILSILTVLGYTISKMSIDFKLPEWNYHFDSSKIVTPVSIQLFIITDVILALIYLDSYLRKGKLKAQKKGDF